MIPPNQTFKTENLLLRPLQSADLDEMAALTADPEMWVYFTADLSNEEELKQWINSAINDSSRLAFTIIDRKTNSIIGSTSIGNISARDKRAEIGWTWIAKSYQGKGYNAAVKLILFQYLFEDCNFERVEFKTDVLNIPARMALKKMGLTEEGILRSHTPMTRNRRRDTIYYSVLKGEWEEVKSRNKLL